MVVLFGERLCNKYMGLTIGGRVSGWQLAAGDWQIVLRNEFEQPKYYWDPDCKTQPLERL